MKVANNEIYVIIIALKFNVLAIQFVFGSLDVTSKLATYILLKNHALIQLIYKNRIIYNHVLG